MADHEKSKNQQAFEAETNSDVLTLENTTKPNLFMEELMKKYTSMLVPKSGDIVSGTILSKAKGEIFVDLNFARPGIIYGREYNEARGILKNLKIGDQISAKVIDPENESGYIELSLAQASTTMSWQEIEKKFQEGTIFPVKITEANRGGLVGEINGKKAFLPVSQLSSEHYPRVDGGDKNKILQELQKFIGLDLNVKIIDFKQDEEKIIISERSLQDSYLKNVLANFKIGDIVEAEVTGAADFGVFVKFPVKEILTEKSDQKPITHLEGLIHISELDWQLIENPKDVVKSGDKLQAKIISIDGDKISLSSKALRRDSWLDIDKKYKVGDEVSGEIMKLNPYGAFVRLDENIHGLCHISEFGTEQKMKELVEPTKKYKFKIISIAPTEHRMSLGFLEKSPLLRGDPEKPKDAPKTETI